MRVFLTGANGFIGSAVARVLERRGHTIHALARTPAAQESASAHRYKVIKGSLEEPRTLEVAGRDADAVIHCGNTGDARQGEVDSAATRAMLVPLRGTGRRFIYTSGVWLYGNTGDTPADESTRLNPPEIVTWRAEVEREVLDASKAGAHTIVIRPGDVFGQRRGLPGMLLGNVLDGAVEYIGDGDNRWPLVYVDDLAELYALALENAPAGVVYNATGPTSERVRDVAAAAAESLGLSETRSIPLEVARQKFGAFADALCLDQVVSNRKARTQLHWAPSNYTIYEDFGVKR
jgi:nucleoside-diphosphate-sugar epimerase